jgi:HK97 family phage prohead protease
MSCKIGTKCYLQNSVVNEIDKSVEVILSDESNVQRFSWEDGEFILILSHEESAVNLERAEILSLFVNHETNDLPIGRFTNVRLEDKKLKATAVFDPEDEQSMKIFKKLSKGFLQSFSVGVNIDEKVLLSDEDGVKTYTATKWSLFEASVVGIPAIPNAKIGLHYKMEANPTASGDNSKTNIQGADMKFDRENLDATEEAFKALVANKDTLSNRNESLSLQLQTAQTALEAMTEQNVMLQAEHTTKLSEAEANLVSFKAETTTRMEEAINEGVDLKVALAMVNADSKETSSKLALDAKESNGRTTQTPPLDLQKTAILLYAEKNKGSIS